MLNIKRPEDVVVVLLMGILLVGFLFMVSGYTILIKQALRCPDRRESLKRVYDWRGREDQMDHRGLSLIFTGAIIRYGRFRRIWRSHRLEIMLH